MRARRYQLRKDAVAIVRGGHPWIFREQLSSAANVFSDGDWLRLVDGANQVVGHGIYEAEGAIAIRMLSRGEQTPNAEWLRGALATALGRRVELAAHADGIRLLNGESDGIPAVVADRFGDTIVISSYSLGADALARYIATALAPTHIAGFANAESVASVAGSAARVLLRPARRRRGPSVPARLLRGLPAEIVAFNEDDMHFAVDLEGGHKTGTYLDLRALRRAVATAPLAGARVLNLFAYSGMLGRAAEVAGAHEIVQVDQSERALAFAASHHVTDAGKHRFVTADIFDWLPAQPGDAAYDLVIVAQTSDRRGR